MLSKWHKTLQNRENVLNPLTFLDPRTCAQSRQARSARKLRLSRQGRLFQTVKYSDTRHSESKTSSFSRCFFFNFRFADIFWQKSNSLTFSGKSKILRLYSCIVTLDLYISDLVSIFGSLSDVLGGKSNWHNEDSRSLWNTFNSPFKSLSLMLSPTIIPNITLLRILTIIPLF